MKKRFLITVILLAVLLCALVLPAAADDGITVLVDGETLTFDVEPQIIGGRTMVPVRKIFEHLGADVYWHSYDNSFRAACGHLEIDMQVGNNTMTVSGKEIYLDVPPVIIDSRTLVPLRAIAEAFSAEVTWIGETRTADIKTPYPYSAFVREEPFNAYHFRTSYSEHEYLDLSISGDILTVKGVISDREITDVMIEFGTIYQDKRFSIAPASVFETEVNLAEIDIEDKTTLNILFKYDGMKYYQSYIYDRLFIKNTGVDYTFERPLVLAENNSFLNFWKNPIAYIDPNIDEKLVALSNEICEGAESDYEKAQLIHDWVADNIYYDYRYYTVGSDAVVFEAIDVYETKRAACTGYAYLTMALLHAQNIPCKTVRGYALGTDAKNNYWTNEEAITTQVNHEWNQAYIDNRWINIDTTWDSANKYENNSFTYGGIRNRLYFDTTTAFMSYSHKYMH